MEQPNRPPTLPKEIHENVFERLNVVDKVTNASTVCYAWFEFCKDPSLWRVLDMRGYPIHMSNEQLVEMCKYAVTKSQGQLEEVYIDNVATNELLEMIVDSSPSLKVLHLNNCHEVRELVLRQTVARLQSLKELSISVLMMTASTIDLIGTSCPLLKTFYISIDNYNVFNGFNEHALGIGRSMTKLQRLTIASTGNLTNAGIEAILNGCRQLVSLDIEHCVNLVLTEHMREMCLSTIKNLKLPPNIIDGIDVNWDEFRHCGD